MPISIVQVNRERSLSGLAKRVYRIEGPGSAELTRRAEAALLAANPHLSERTSFRAGVTVLVPDVPGLDFSDEPRSAAREADGILGSIDRSLAALAEGALAALAEMEKQADGTVQELKTTKMQKIIEKNAPALLAEVPKVQEAAGKRAAEAKDRQTALASVLEKAKDDLAKLSKQLG
jgi:hypothetical protein